MSSLTSHVWKARKLSLASLLLLIPMLILSACGADSGSTTTQDKGSITIGGKKDAEAELFTELYTLILEHKGFKVNSKLAFGNTPQNFAAIKSGDIDLYAEFTGTALNILNLNSTYDPQKDYDAIKQQYKDQYKITWLDRAADLNDGYALCINKNDPQTQGITTISELASKVSQFQLETASDGTSFVDGLKKTYNFDSNSFKKTETVDYSVALTSVGSKQAQVAVCYGTDTGVDAQGLKFLQDDKNGFPAFNPSPIIRDEVLKKYPEIADDLNPLAKVLTTDVSISLQKQLVEKQKSESQRQALKDVATDFLKSKGLL
ncbi:ABC transporter substrate-binding protein [Tengunoibacter tsumagoiensis]|uniref:Glycine/betaine ABC transporter substrate-binding protein n=1 Tax=Tengunoibacter tsumagoiensis TaxID=2014871 RepID=A0A401ZXI6_9CHLR|nr:glycine betaine ABC transporter substrate-binding protein [Tengunoibacter tsumagoiensis]GCE11568.1 glycine/betaine ABC transporter substrate-binding protein [Tengunoibacter tsumagoiensis]